MSLPSTSTVTPTTASATDNGPGEVCSTTEIDGSCRWPLLLIFFSASFWLVLNSVLGLITSVKLHAPGFLADCAWLSYGRVSPAQTNALMFGFASPAAVAVALWLLCRLGRTRLALPWLITIAALFWNLGLAIGIAGILAGDSTGISGLELPRYAAPILLAAYLIFGVCALITFH